MIIWSASSVSATDYCTPSGCPSGYIDGGVSCGLNGLDFVCTRICYIVAGCGNYDEVTTYYKEEQFKVNDDTDKNIWFYSPSSSESSSYCYKYRAKTYMAPTDCDPGGILHYAAQRYTITAITTWDEAGGGCFSCNTYSTGVTTTAWHIKGRGETGSGRVSAGKVIPYRNSQCSNEAWGIEGWLTTRLEYKKAPWIPADNENKQCSGTCDCLSGVCCDGCYYKPKQTSCGTNRECDGSGGCVTCTTHAYSTCSDNDVYYYDACDYREEKRYECGSNSCAWTGLSTCDGDNVVQKKECHDRGCSNDACYDDEWYTDYEIRIECQNGCQNGACINECNSDSDCGAGGWIYFCGYGSWGKTDGNAYKIYETRRCKYPGSGSGASYCYSDYGEAILVDICDYGCENGQCIEIECDSNSDCGTDGWFGDPFCGTNGWPYYIGSLYQKYVQYTCNNPGTEQSSCSENYIDVNIAFCTRSDCTDWQDPTCYNYCDAWQEDYCKNDDVYHSRTCHDRGCTNGACYDNVNIEEQLKEDCSHGCYLGVCLNNFNQFLTPGWNLISIPLILDDNSVASVFTGLSYSKLFYYDSAWKEPTEINNTKGYWIKMNNADTLTVDGLPPENTPINLNSGWNLIGHPSLEENNTSELYNKTTYAYNNSAWYSYNPDRPSNTLTKFTPGYGYWINNK